EQDGQLALQQIEPLVVRPHENDRSLRPCLDARPQDKWQPNQEAPRIARPERTQFCLPSYRFWFCYPARPAPTLAEQVSVLSDEPVQQLSCVAKRKTLSQCADDPCGLKQTRQTRDGIPADMDFTFRGNDMQLTKTLFHSESGIDCRQDLCGDGEAHCLVLVVESFQPLHTRLTNFTLLVVEHPVR